MTPDQAATLTRCVIVGTFAVLFVYTYAMKWQFGADATISIQFNRMCHEHPMISFVAGLLIGHWLWELR